MKLLTARTLLVLSVLLLSAAAGQSEDLAPLGPGSSSSPDVAFADVIMISAARPMARTPTPAPTPSSKKTPLPTPSPTIAPTPEPTESATPTPTVLPTNSTLTPSGASFQPTNSPSSSTTTKGGTAAQAAGNSDVNGSSGSSASKNNTQMLVIMICACVAILAVIPTVVMFIYCRERRTDMEEAARLEEGKLAEGQQRKGSQSMETPSGDYQSQFPYPTPTTALGYQDRASLFSGGPVSPLPVAKRDPNPVGNPPAAASTADLALASASTPIVASRDPSQSQRSSTSASHQTPYMVRSQSHAGPSRHSLQTRTSHHSQRTSHYLRHSASVPRGRESVKRFDDRLSVGVDDIDGDRRSSIDVDVFRQRMSNVQPKSPKNLRSSVANDSRGNLPNTKETPAEEVLNLSADRQSMLQTETSNYLRQSAMILRGRISEKKVTRPQSARAHSKVERRRSSINVDAFRQRLSTAQLQSTAASSTNDLQGLSSQKEATSVAASNLDAALTNLDIASVHPEVEF